MARSSKALPTETGMLVVRSCSLFKEVSTSVKIAADCGALQLNLQTPHSQTTCAALWQGGLPVAATLLQGYVFRTAPGGIKDMKVIEDVLR